MKKQDRFSSTVSWIFVALVVGFIVWYEATDEARRQRIRDSGAAVFTTDPEPLHLLGRDPGQDWDPPQGNGYPNP
jgi:hypothetical protein